MTDAPLALPRLLTIMGSGETSPTMVKVHRQLLGRLGPAALAVVLDTPFGFQANADELTAKAVAYFRESVGHELGVASLRSTAADALVRETAVARLRSASYVFAGPGSPSYALRQWEDSALPGALVDKLRGGGAVTFASAAALTLGVVTIPVYEIYKAGEAPHWLPGLDLLAEAGLSAAVIPHYNNAEGGTHDTRFCYMGEERLAVMERDLPAGAFVLGVDEHTGLVLDLDAGTASVVGLGVVTIRHDGHSREIATGTMVSITDLGRPIDDAGANEPASSPRPPPPVGAPTVGGVDSSSPLMATVAQLDEAFEHALAARDASGAAAAALDLDEALVAWSNETFSSDEMERARSALRSMIVRLAEAAGAGLQDPRTVLGPFVDALLDQRAAARADKRWADADAVRDQLVNLGIEVNDSPEGTTWALLS